MAMLTYVNEFHSTKFTVADCTMLTYLLNITSHKSNMFTSKYATKPFKLLSNDNLSLKPIKPGNPDQGTSQTSFAVDFAAAAL